MRDNLGFECSAKEKNVPVWTPPLARRRQKLSDEFIELLVKQTEDANGILLPRVEEWLVWFYRHINVKKKISFNGQHIFISTSVSYFIFMFHRENPCNLKHEKPPVEKAMHETSVCKR